MICDECMREFPKCMFPGGFYKRINFNKDSHNIVIQCAAFKSGCLYKLTGECRRECYIINQCKRCR